MEALLRRSAPAPVLSIVKAPETRALIVRSARAGLSATEMVRLPPRSRLPEIVDPTAFAVEVTERVPPRVRVPAPVLTW